MSNVNSKGKFDKRKKNNRGSNSSENKLHRAEVVGTETKVNSKDFYKSDTNDWRWYANDEQLLRDVASFAYGYATGTKLNLGEFADNINENAIPGVMAIRFIPTVGWSDHATSPVNVAARNLYTYIRHANSGAKNYDSPDLMLYLLAIDSANAYLEYLKRIYGAISVTNVVNRYYPIATVRAMGVDYNDILANLANFRAYINIYAAKLGSMCIPSHMSLMAKHKWMNAGMYLDSVSDKAQTYLFVPEGFHMFGHDDDGAGKLNFKALPSGLDPTHANTFQELRTFGDDLLNPILYGYGEEDFNIISGDILKAYGPEGVYRPEGISETYVVMPAYDEVVLSQIQNCTMYGQLDTDFPNFDITQSIDKAYLIAQPKRFYLTPKVVNPACIDRLLVSPMANPDPSFTMEASRLCNIASYTGEVTNSLEYHQCGSEITTRGFIYWYTPDGDGALSLNQSYEIQSNITLSTELNATASQTLVKALNIFRSLGMLTNFDWHPLVTVAGMLTTPGQDEIVSEFQPYGFIGDVNNYTILTKANLGQLSEVALLSQFGIETFGKSSLK
jgi:hypothetical protein